MGCFGSVMLYAEEDSYCAQCPLREACAIQVAKNQELMQEALGRPVFEAHGKYWASAVQLSRKKRAMAAEMSTSGIAPAKAPKPAASKPAPVTVAPLSKLTPSDAFDAGEKLPKKVRERLDKWVQKGVDPSLIERSINPFDHISGCKVDLLIAAIYIGKGKQSKSDFTAWLAASARKDDGEPWTLAAVQSNLNIIAGAFKACGYELYTENE